MLFSAFKSLSQQFLVISGLVVVCAVVAWLLNGRQAAVSLVDTAVIGMKGPWVWTFGFGLASFVAKRGRLLPLDINGVVVPSEVTAARRAELSGPPATGARIAIRCLLRFWACF